MPKDASVITIGSGAKIEIDDIDIGYLDGDVSFKRSSETKTFTSGIPKKNVKRVAITDGFNTTFKMAQFTNKNIAIAALNLPYTEVAGGASGTITTQQLTMVKRPGFPLATVNLNGPGSAYTVTAVRITSSGTTPLDNTGSAHYFVDTTYGIIAANSEGDIGEDVDVWVTYSYTKRAKSRVSLGKTQAIVTKKFLFQHLTPELREINVGIHKLQASGDFELLFSAENWLNITVDGEAQDDSENHPDDPYGYIDEVEAA